MSDEAVRLLREAVRLLADSRRNFKSRQVEQARRLLETILQLECPHEKNNDETRPHAPQKNGAPQTDLDHD